VATRPHPVVFLVDVDNTLLDNDRFRSDLWEHLERELGTACRDRYWEIQEQLFVELGYRDYLGAAQLYWLEHPEDPRFLEVSAYLLDYPFAERLFPGALAVLARFKSFGPTVVLTDGDVIFQPRKIDRSGIRDAADGNVLVYIHKEAQLDDVEQRFPARHFVVVDDKPRILAAVKRVWGDRVTTVLPLQGQFASDPEALASTPPPDVIVSGIGELLDLDVRALVETRAGSPG
jgi:haloacid dehalogenase-like hydrolase